MKRKVKNFEINKVAQELIEKVSKSKSEKAIIIAMSGDLGAGKTTLTQEIAKKLGVRDMVVSPTFVIMKIYKTNLKSDLLTGIKRLIHIDAYRLERAKDIEKIGWKNIYEDKENLIIIEWPENIKNYLDSKCHYVYLKHIDEETRIFEY